MAKIRKYLPEPPYLQVALDVIEVEKAVLIAKEVAISTKVILEAGTPLIKSEGVFAIKLLSSIFPKNPVLADMKTMDVGALESDLAFRNGALITTVLGVADESTITSAVEKSNEMDKLVQVDLINVKNIVERAEAVYSMGAHIIGIHAGIDQQTGKKQRAIDLMHVLTSIRDRVGKDVYISIAGGIQPSEIKQFVQAGADIIVVGSAITKSNDPKKVVEKIFNEELK